MRSEGAPSNVTTLTASERPAHSGGPKPLLDGRQSYGRSALASGVTADERS
jgi:hypothetical protein